MGLVGFALVVLLVAIVSCSAMPHAFFGSYGGGAGQSLDEVAQILAGGDSYSGYAYDSTNIGIYGGLGNFAGALR